MLIEPAELIENTRIGLGHLKNIQKSAIFLNQRRLNGHKFTSKLKKSEDINEHDRGLRVWIQRENKTYFYFFPIQSPQQQISQLKNLDQNSAWRVLNIKWPFEEISSESLKYETSFKDSQISVVDSEEILQRFENLRLRMDKNTSKALKNKVIDSYQLRFRHVENEEYLWTNGSKRSISHTSSRYLIDAHMSLMDSTLCKGHEEAKFFNLDWSKASRWTEDWFSTFNTSGSSEDPAKFSHTFFSDYATKQLSYAVQSWIVKTKNPLPFGDAILNNNHVPNRFVNIYDNPGEAQVCGRRVWDARGTMAKPIKYFDQGEWSLEDKSDIPTRIRGTQKYPEPTLCNLVFAPGRSDRVDLMAKSKKGLWISSFEDFDVDEGGVFQGKALASVYNMNPRFVSPIGIVKIVAPLKQVLGNIEDVARHLQWYHSIGSSDWLVSNEGINISLV